MHLGGGLTSLILHSEEPQSWRKRESMQREQKGEDQEEARHPALGVLKIIV